jgi:hypothetical protein
MTQTSLFVYCKLFNEYFFNEDVVSKTKFERKAHFELYNSKNDLTKIQNVCNVRCSI